MTIKEAMQASNPLNTSGQGDITGNNPQTKVKSNSPASSETDYPSVLDIVAAAESISKGAKV